MQTTMQEKLSIKIAMGWVMLLLVLAVSLLMMVVAGIMADDGFSIMRKDPGKGGMMLLVYVFGFYSVMPIAVSLAQNAKSSAARWVVVAVTVFLFLFFFVHHMSHWVNGERPSLNSHFLEIAHHCIALWVISLSILWARMPKPVAAHPGSGALVSA
jgi:hypothetical protein